MRLYVSLLLLLVVGCTSKPQEKPIDSTTLHDQQQAPKAPKVQTEEVGRSANHEDHSTTLRDEQQPLKALKAQAEELGQSAVQEDHAKTAKLTHPVLIEIFGGHAAYAKKLESMAAEMKEQGFRLKNVTIGDPSELAPAAGQLYAVVPTEVQLSGPGGATGRQPSCLIAVSGDGGAHWQFVDGSGFNGDRSKLKSLFPEFPERLALPAAKPAVWDKK